MIFVTAYAIIGGQREPRQGWLLAPGDEFIIGESGTICAIVGGAVAVSNPPDAPSEAAQHAARRHPGREAPHQ